MLSLHPRECIRWLETALDAARRGEAVARARQGLKILEAIEDPDGKRCG